MSPKIITKPNVTIAPDLLDEIRSLTEEVGQVVLHFVLRNNHSWPSRIRIWPTTYLIDRSTEHRSELVHVENIALYPSWQSIPPLSDSYFTLIFSGLPKSCTAFDFVEECGGQNGAFRCDGISRNQCDVYYLSI